MIFNNKNNKYFKAPSLNLDADFVNFNNYAQYTNLSLIYALNNVFVEIKNKGLWSRIPRLNILVSDKVSNTDRQNQIKYNLINPTTYQLTFYGNPTIGNNGMNLDGSTQYADTGFNYNTFYGTSNKDCGILTFYTGTTLGVCGVIETNSTFRSNQTILNNGELANVCVGREIGTTYNHGVAQTGSIGVLSWGANNQSLFYQGLYRLVLSPTFRGQPVGTRNLGRRGGSVIFYGTNPVVIDLDCYSFTYAEFCDLTVLLNTFLGNAETALSIPAGTLKKY